jgi:hypothetical protein
MDISIRAPNPQIYGLGVMGSGTPTQPSPKDGDEWECNEPPGDTVPHPFSHEREHKAYACGLGEEDGQCPSGLTDAFHDSAGAETVLRLLIFRMKSHRPVTQRTMVRRVKRAQMIWSGRPA